MGEKEIIEKFSEVAGILKSLNKALLVEYQNHT